MSSESLAVCDPSSEGTDSSSNAMPKIVVIQVRSRRYCGASHLATCERREDAEGHAFEWQEGRILCTKVMNTNKGKVAFWVLSTTGGKSLHFESAFLKGAVAAVVVLGRSDRETIQEGADLLRGICKLFSIPVMIVVGSRSSENGFGLYSAIELARIASKVIGFVRVERDIIRAS